MNNQDQIDIQKTKKNKKTIKILIIVIIILALAIAAFAAVFTSKLQDRNSQETKFVESITNRVAGYDIQKLSRTYPDICAWLDIPNTNISVPIVQHPSNDSYYLAHSPQGVLDQNGAAYIELCNSKDFSDPVTVVYGHNMNDGSMFSSIHNFSNKTFFEENDKFYVYIQGHKLTYTVAAAAVVDDSHIMNSHNFKDTQVFNKYKQDIMTSLSTSKVTRSGLDISEYSKILQLSTCMSDPALQNQRYVVTGVLTDDQPTI